MFVSQNPEDNMFSLVAFIIFISVIWPIYIGKFICLFNHSQFNFGIYVVSVILEIIILVPISYWLDKRAERNNE